MQKKQTKKKLLLRKESIQALDDVNLSLVVAGNTTLPPPNGGHPSQMG